MGIPCLIDESRFFCIFSQICLSDFHYQNQMFIFCPFLHVCYYYTLQIDTNSLAAILFSAGFTYRLDRLTPRASEFRGPPPKVYNIFKSVVGLSHLCCHNVRYFLNNPSVSFLTQLHFILEYCRILNTPYHLRLIEID